MNDSRFALRQMMRRPGTALAVVLTLAIGMGASTAIFSVVNGVLLQPLPYPEPDRIVRVFHQNEAGASYNLSDPDFSDLRARTASFEGLAQFGTGMVSVAGGDQPTRSMRAQVSEDFFTVMRVQPAWGRAFATGERHETAPPTVIVSHRYWQRYMGGADPAGRTLRIDDREHAIVGVMPDGFHYPDGAEVWTPRELARVTPSRTAHNWQAIGRLAPGVTRDSAGAELAGLVAALRAELGDETTIAGVGIVTLHEHTVGRLRTMLSLLLGAAILLAIIAWANVASLLLARVNARQRELAARVAVGAGKARLVRQFLVEAALLVLAGCAAGLVIAVWGLEAFRLLLPSGMPRMDTVGIDSWAIAFTLVLGALAACGLGAAVAGRATRAGIALAANQRDGGSRGRDVATRGLVVAQIAMALVLLIGAGLLGRSFHAVMQVEPGFTTDRALVMRLALPWPRDEADAIGQTRFHETLLAEVRALPGVSHAGITNLVPLAPGQWNGIFIKLAHPLEVTDFESWQAVMATPGRTGQGEYRIVSEGFHETLGIPLLRGQGLGAADAADGLHAAVVSESLAAANWPGEDPVGKIIHFANMDGIMVPLAVVGVVGDLRHEGLEQPHRPTVYAHYQQRAGRLAQAAYVIRTAGPPLDLVPQLRHAVAGLDPELPPAFTTMEELFSASVAQRRFALALIGVFGGAALLLSLVGIYGAMAFSVSRRTREIGLRIAVGARAGQVAGMVIGSGVRMTLWGIGLGLAAALVLVRTVESLMFGVQGLDPATFTLASAGLLLIAAFAAWLPARRAARIDPMMALREE